MFTYVDKFVLIVLASFVLAAPFAWASDNDYLQLRSDNEQYSIITQAPAKIDLVRNPLFNTHRVELLVHDEYGNELLHRFVARGEGVDSIYLSNGYYEITTRMELAPGAWSHKVQSLAVIDMVDGRGGATSNFGFFGVDYSLPHVVLAGGLWNRAFIHLKGYEQSGNRYSWRYGWKEANLSDSQLWIGQLTPIPEWLESTALIQSKGRGARPPSDWDQLYALTYWVLRNEKRRFNYVEVLNEPEWNWVGSDEQLIRYFSVISNAVHAAIPEVKVLGPTFATVNIEKLQSMYQKGLFHYIDGISMHAYVNGTAPEHEFMARIRALKAFINKSDKPDMPIFITEYGWTTSPGVWARPVSTLQQAQYLSRSLVLLKSEGIKAILPFCLLYKSDNRGEAGFSVLNDDATPKPAYVAYSVAVKWLNQARGADPIIRNDGKSFMATYLSYKGSISVRWRTEGEEKVLIPDCNRRVIEDWMGRDIHGASNCVYTISPSPIYVTSTLD